MSPELLRQHSEHKARTARFWNPKFVPKVSAEQQEIEMLRAEIDRLRQQIAQSHQARADKQERELRDENQVLRVEIYKLKQRYDRPSEYAHPIKMSDIKAICAETFGVTVGDIESATRKWLPVRARTAAAWLGGRLSKKSSTEIGMTLGGRDHSTILAAFRRADKLLECDKEFAKQLVDMREKLISTVGNAP